MTTTPGVFIKDPEAILDYVADWGPWLDGDVPDEFTWIVPTGITQMSATSDATTATIWLSGGTLGQNYRVTSRIVTTAGRTDDRTITIQVRAR